MAKTQPVDNESDSTKSKEIPIEVPPAEEQPEQPKQEPLYGNEGYKSDPISAPPEKGPGHDKDEKPKKG